MPAKEVEFGADRREKALDEVDIRLEATKASRAAEQRALENLQFERGYN
jgi:hypothetical protein